jgi:hypothetical protein
MAGLRVAGTWRAAAGLDADEACPAAMMEPGRTTGPLPGSRALATGNALCGRSLAGRRLADAGVPASAVHKTASAAPAAAVTQRGTCCGLLPTSP